MAISPVVMPDVSSPASTSYATVAQLLERYDARLIGDIVSDDNEQVAAAALPANAKVLASLADASGDIESALLVARRYSAAELAGLTGHAQMHLIRMTCDIAMSYLLRRRVGTEPEKLAAFLDLAERHLEKLRKGINVFGLDDQMDAGLPEVTGPTSVDFQNMNLMRDRVHNYYPARRLPFNR